MKKNGFSWPFHPFQVASWIAYFLNILSYFGVIAPWLSSISIILVIGLSFLYFILNGAVIVYAIKAMKWNPTDRAVLLNWELMKKGIVPEKKEKSALYCQVWESYVNERTKHCGEWNRCVELFDHHWKWLNNCIGAKNYKTFIILIILVGIQTFYYTLAGFAFIILGFSKKTRPKKVENGPWMIEKRDSKGIAIIVTVLVLVLMLVSGIISIGIFLLLKLHYKLMKFDFTTFEYIQYCEGRKMRLERL